MPLIFEDLYRAHDDYVRRLCRGMVRDADLSDDLAQEVWMAVLAALPGFRGEAKPTTWIFTIARRVILRQRARERRRGLADFAWTMMRQAQDAAPPPGRGLDDWVLENCHRCVVGMAHCLAPDKRLVWVLREMLGLPHTEVARITGRSEAAVRQIHSRGARRIGRFLEGNCPLFNPASDCSCRMKRLLPDSALRAEVASTAVLVERLFTDRDAI